VSYGATAWLFAITAPFLIYVNAAKHGNLSPAEFNLDSAVERKVTSRNKPFGCRPSLIFLTAESVCNCWILFPDCE
jgi:hypothetical protein